MKEHSSQLVRYRNLFKHVRSLGVFFKNKSGYHGSEVLEFQLQNELSLRVPRTRMVEFKTIVMDDCYLKGFDLEALRSTENLTIWDIGANLGIAALYFKSRFPGSTIYCFEPLPENFEALQRNLQANTTEGFVAIEAGVASKVGSQTLYSGTDEQFSTVFSSIAVDGADYAVTIEVVRAEDVMRRYSVDRIDLLKMDCEGAEYDIFYNSDPRIFDKVDRIAMEVHEGAGERETVSALCEQLADLGFYICVAEDTDFVWAAKDPVNLLEVTSGP